MAFTKITGTQNAFLVRYLRGTQKELSPNQANSLYGIKNLSARMSELYNEGFGVRSRKNSVGTTSYKMVRRMSWEK